MLRYGVPGRCNLGAMMCTKPIFFSGAAPLGPAVYCSIGLHGGELEIWSAIPQSHLTDCHTLSSAALLVSVAKDSIRLDVKMG